MATMRRLVALLLVLAASRGACQDATGKRVDISFDMAGLRASTLRVDAGLDIARFLGMGVIWGMGFDDPGILDLQAGVWCTAALLSEGELGFPVSLTITGTFLKIVSSGDSLERENLVRSGTAGAVGAEVSRTFAFSEVFGLVLAFEGEYRFSTMTTEAIAGSSSTFETLIVPEAELLFGLRVAVSARLTEHLGVVAGVRARFDRDFAIHYGPGVAFFVR